MEITKDNNETFGIYVSYYPTIDAYNIDQRFKDCKNYKYLSQELFLSSGTLLKYINFL